MPTITDGSAAAKFTMGASLLVSSEDKVDSTPLGDEDPVALLSVEEDEYGAISVSNLQLLLTVGESCCSFDMNLEICKCICS